MNGEFVCEMVRAHYDGDSDRFDTILGQLIRHETLKGNDEVADRLRDIRSAVPSTSKEQQ